MESRWIIVSNRLPFNWDSAEKRFKRSSGGLVTAIEGIKNSCEKIWYGLYPGESGKKELGEAIQNEESGKFEPIYIDQKTYDKYYNGFSNSILWPLLHYEMPNLSEHESSWEAYCKVNHQIATQIAETCGNRDLIWIHDFHLMMVPMYLRKLKPKARIGFFLHVPFPSSEIWRQMPMRSELLHGLMGADLIGFHDYSYLRHFISSLELLEGINPESYAIRYDDRLVSLGVFPVSIDTGKFKSEASSEKVSELIAEISGSNSYEYTILGIDRLDYTKGLDLKLEAFEKFLQNDKELSGKVRLLQIAVPTREKVEEYQELKYSIEQKVAEINGKYGTLTDAPVRYMYSSIPMDSLLALYRSSDILLVSSKRDGMNLVCQEYIVAQDPEDPGIVVLSEFAGAASNLSGVELVNPWDTTGVATALARALRVPLEDRKIRHQEMQSYLEQYTATAWAEYFMNQLRNQSDSLDGKSIDVIDPSALSVSQARTFNEQLQKERLHMFIDFDGTLAAIAARPELAVVSEPAKSLLYELKNEGVDIIVSSGRDAAFLEKQLGAIGVYLGAEHGSQFFDPQIKEWQSLIRGDLRDWYSQAEHLLEEHVKRVPGSFIERKKFGLAWHYRLGPKEFSDFQARKITFELKSRFKDLPVLVVNGKKVIEVKSFEADKGMLCRWYLDKIGYHTERDGLIAVGDDTTDEDMFKAVKHGVTIKIGPGSTQAYFAMPRQADVIKLLQYIADFRRSKAKS